MSCRQTVRGHVHHACAKAPMLGGRWLAAARAARETRRVPVPSQLIDAVRFAAERPDLVAERFWDDVREQIEDLITDEVPEGADGIRAILDEDRNEVVVSYRP